MNGEGDLGRDAVAENDSKIEASDADERTDPSKLKTPQKPPANAAPVTKEQDQIFRLFLRVMTATRIRPTAGRFLTLPGDQLVLRIRLVVGWY